MFRKPVRLEKWIAFDGAVGAEVVDAVLEILDADADSFDNNADTNGGDGNVNPDGQPDGPLSGAAGPADDAVNVEVTFYQAAITADDASGTDYVDKAPDWYTPHHLEDYDQDNTIGCDIDGNSGFGGQDIHFLDSSEDATIDNDANSFLPFWKNDSDQGTLQFALLYKNAYDHFSTWHRINQLDFTLTPSEGGAGSSGSDGKNCGGKS